MDRMSSITWKEAIAEQNERLGIKPPPIPPPRAPKKPAASVGHVDVMAERDELARVLRPRHVAGEMNGMEKRYAAYLETRRLCGEIAKWRFEAIKLKLARATFLNIDFMVTMLDNHIELHETKGHMEDDAIVKLKIAAQMFPEFRIVVVKEVGKPKRWSFRDTANREVIE